MTDVQACLHLVDRVRTVGEDVVRETAHRLECRFSACGCGAVEAFRMARSEFYRRKARYEEARGSAG